MGYRTIQEQVDCVYFVWNVWLSIKGGTMQTTLQPGSVNQTEIDTFSKGLDHVGQTPRLIGPDGYTIELPHALHDLLRHIASELQAGNGVTILPISAVLTTAQTAEMLNVSRPHVVKLIDQGKIPHHMAGTHRRVNIADVAAYKAVQDNARHEALVELHAIADESGMDL